MKRFYWIKLHTNFFNEDKIDFLMSQENGAQYVVLYQMLCLKTVNSKGNLANTVGDVLVPYDIPKIVRDCKYFTQDTVIVALELYKKLGLIFETENQILQISNYDEIVGSESPSAGRMRLLRARNKEASHCDTDVTQEKELELETELDLLVNNKNINNLSDNQQSRARACEIVDNLKNKYSNLIDLYSKTSIYNIFEEVFFTLANFECNAPIKFDGIIYKKEDFQKCWEKLTNDKFLSIIRTLRYSDQDIKDREYYILGAFINAANQK